MHKAKYKYKIFQIAKSNEQLFFLYMQIVAYLS